MTPVLPRHLRTALCASALLLGACEQPAAPGEGETPLIVQVELNQQPIATLTVEVTGTGIPSPLVFNLQITNGVASGTINVPVGPARTFIGRAFDATGLETHGGQATIDVRPGMNPNLPLPLLPRAGGVPLTLTLTTVAVAVTPAAATVQAGQSVQLGATVTDGLGNPVSLAVSWATGNAALATVDQTGLVNGLVAGQVQIVASAGGAAAIATVTVTPGPAPLTQWASVTSGGAHTCGLTTAGVAYCWGDNSSGQLGDATTTSRPKPMPVFTTLTFTQLVAGAAHTCGIETVNQNLYCWGANAAWQLGDGTTTLRSAPVQALAFVGVVPWEALAAGQQHTCASTTSSTGGTICWGSDLSGQLGDGPTNSSGGAAIIQMGFTTMTAGLGHTCGATVTGDIYCWGLNNHGQIGDGTTSDQHAPTLVSLGVTGVTVEALTAGDHHTCTIVLFQGVRGTACWGRNHVGQLGDGTTTSGNTGPVGGDQFMTISAGVMHTCAVSLTNGALCWGANANGQAGDPNPVSRFVPTAVVGGLSFVSVDAGAFHTCGVTTGAAIYCWGLNNEGRLGDGTTSTHATPSRVVEP